MEIADAVAALRRYDRPLRIMEVCGTHTSSIIRHGIRSLVSPAIALVSGPGCPVCVTPSAYIDRLAAIAATPGHRVLTFGDLVKVPGRTHSLARAKAAGGAVEVIYSPLEALAPAAREPDTTFVVAAIGFETTAPVYAVLLKRAQDLGLANIRLLTALKTMPPILEHVCRHEAVDAFLCPGHVSVIIGDQPYRALAQRHRKPFVIAGFEAEHILAAIHEIVRQHENGSFGVENLYGSVVSGRPQAAATALMERYFQPGPSRWRGLGEIAGSGLYLRPEYECFDMGSRDIEDDGLAEGCRCDQVMLGRMQPDACPLFGTACRPDHPVGACMVSGEGACGVWYLEGGGSA